MQTLTSEISVHDQRAWHPTVSPATAGWQAQPWANTFVVAGVAQVAMLLVLSARMGLGVLGWVAAAAYTAVVFRSLAVGLRRSGRTAFGPADKVTLARSALVGCVTALVADTVHQPAPVVLLVTLAVVALALDGVDGQVARRTGTCTPLGARFDMEVDAFLLLVLSAFVAVQFGPWVLAIGLMRYAFIAAGHLLDWMRTPVPSSMFGKAVAAIQGVVLLVASAGVLAPAFTVTLVAVALGGLAWSFGRSVHWLWVNRQVSAVHTH